MTDEQLLKAAEDKMRISMSAVFFVDLIYKIKPLVTKQEKPGDTAKVVGQFLKCIDDADIA